MSRPRFLADHDFNEHIVSGVLRLEPLVDFLRVRDIGMSTLPDTEIAFTAASDAALALGAPYDGDRLKGHGQ
jgi:hypothetical protein